MTPSRGTLSEEPVNSIPADNVPTVDETLDGLVAMQALTSLPDRWRTALWTSIVDELKPVEMAPLLGLSANAVAALLKRARDALRIAYVRTYLPRPTKLPCRQAIEHLARGAVTPLPATQQRTLDEHLGHCHACHDAAETIRTELDSWSRSPDRTSTAMNFRLDDPTDDITSEGVA